MGLFHTRFPVRFRGALRNRRAVCLMVSDHGTDTYTRTAEHIQNI